MPNQNAVVGHIVHTQELQWFEVSVVEHDACYAVSKQCPKQWGQEEIEGHMICSNVIETGTHYRSKGSKSK